MTFLTVFTAPKSFEDPHINIIQRNAIASWTRLGDDVNVIVVGGDPGIAEACADLGVMHFPDVECSEEGTPLLSSIFGLARQNSDADVLAYVNADIILLPDFVKMTRKVFEKKKKFLMVGRRWDLDVTDLIDFNKGWQAELEQDLVSSGVPHKPDGSDYFIFPRGLFLDIPEFRVGRAGWDNWMIYYAVKHPWPAIDATQSIKIIHQNHDYAHLPGGEPHYKHPETFSNVDLAGGYQNMYLLIDLNRELINGRIVHPRIRIVRMIRRLERLIFTGSLQGKRWALTLRLRKLRQRLT